MGERYLIVNADDFGMCESTDRAILRLFREKEITSTTILGPAPHSNEAIREAAEHKLPAGVHWALNSDFEREPWHSVAPSGKVPSLDCGDGLPHDLGLLAKRAKSREVTAELDAQVQKMIRGGCPPDHADNHCGTLYGINGRLFFLNAFRLCRKYRLPFRLPGRPEFLKREFGEKWPRRVQALYYMVIHTAKGMGVDLLDGLITNPWPVRKIPGYEALRAYYLKWAASTEEGITEMFLHPACPDSRMEALTPEWAKREMEYRFLLSGDLRKLAEKEDIRLVSWGQAPFRSRKRSRGSGKQPGGPQVSKG